MDGDGGDEDDEKEVDCNGSLVHGAAALGEEDVHHDGHGEGGGKHAEGRSDEEGAPGFGIVFLDFLKTVFGVGVSEIYEEDEAQENEKHGSS